MARKRSEDIDPGHDELELMKAMLMDKYVNHGLDKILEEVQIIRVQDPENYGEYPGIKLYGGQWKGTQIAEEPDEEGCFVDIFKKNMILQFYVMENQEVEYNGRIYEGVRILTLLRDIIIRIVSDNQYYPEGGSDENVAEFTDIQFDYIHPEMEQWVPMYLGQVDAIALNLGIIVAYEKDRV